MNKKISLAILSILGMLSISLLSYPGSVHGQAGTPYEMITEINNLRAANGLYALAPNDFLMLSAQNHADWIAQTGQGGHMGIDGTYAIDRARAVGYGGGAQIWVTENWARGPGLSVHDCIYVMWDDEAHMGNMLTEWHNEFGVGVALDGQGFTVYVVNFGHTSGSAPAQTTPGSTTPGVEPTQAPFIQPVTTATPNPDGSVIHIVQYGQSLWAIADAYGISLADLLAQNGLTEDSAIYPDQELLIVPAGIETTGETGTVPAETETTAETREPDPTATPTPTRAITATREADPESTQQPTAVETAARRGFLANIFSGDTLYIGIGLVAVSVFGLALLLFTSARLK
jgi:hypothetical protein